MIIETRPEGTQYAPGKELMAVREILKRSIISTFDLYAGVWKRFYTLSIVFLILSNCIAVVPSLISWAILNTSPGSSLDGDALERTFGAGMLQLGRSIAVLNLGLYAIFLLKENRKGFREKPYRLDELFKAISGEEWGRYAILIIILAVLHIVTAQPVFDTPLHSSSLLTGIFGADYNEPEVKILVWLNSIIDLVMQYIPYLFAIFLIHKHFRVNDPSGLHNTYKNSLFAAMILIFCLNNLSGAVISYLDQYVATLIRVPFIDPVAPTLLNIFIYMVIAAFFYLGYAAILVYPFKHAGEEQDIAVPSVDDVLNNGNGEKNQAT
jgi:hypothetical protein